MCPKKLFFSLLMIPFLLPVQLSASSLLPVTEFEALKRIAEVLKKPNWNFSVEPCSGEAGWASRNVARGKENVAVVRCGNCNKDGSIEKADVYSFGIVTLEIVTGKYVAGYANKEKYHLLDMVNSSFLSLVDERLGTEFDKEGALGMISVAIICAHSSPLCRPSMSEAVKMLTGETRIPDFVPDPYRFRADQGCEILRRNPCENGASSGEDMLGRDIEERESMRISASSESDSDNIC